MAAAAAGIGIVLVLSIGVGHATEPRATAAVRAAVQTAVERRLGGAVVVTLEDFTCSLTSDVQEALVATPNQLGRTARSFRFAIATATGPRGHGVRVGEASAIVHVSGAHVRAVGSFSAGRILTAGDLETASGPIDGVPLRRIPLLHELIGGRLMRPLVAGDPITLGAVAMVPAVHAGDMVRVRVHQGDVDATMTVVAGQTADIDQIIRVVNPSSRHALRARVVAPGQVEVVDAP